MCFAFRRSKVQFLASSSKILPETLAKCCHFVSPVLELEGQKNSAIYWVHMSSQHFKVQGDGDLGNAIFPSYTPKLYFVIYVENFA